MRYQILPPFLRRILDGIQDGFYRAVHIPVSARRGQSADRHVENAVAHFSFLQPHRLGGLYHHLHPDWIYFWEEVEITRSLAGANGALPDFCGDNPHGSGRDFRHSLSKFSVRHFSKDVSESINEQHSTVKFLEHLL